MMTDHISADSFWTPWEYRVCNLCCSNNPYAIWLVKVGCFQPHRHVQCAHTRVVIDSEDMVLEPIRPVPMKFKSLRGSFIMHKETFCPRNDSCTYAHSHYEVDMWNVKKRLARANWSFVSQLSHHSLDSQCPSEVCRLCFEDDTKAIWLAWLKCTNTEQHSPMNTVTVVVEGLHKELVKVRPCPAGVTQLSQVKICSGHVAVCSSTCQQAHSNGELLYWQWQVARNTLFKQDINYEQLNNVYSYPDERSELITRALSKKLTTNNYHSKFHVLVYLEEMESSRKIISETKCNSTSATIRLEWSVEECNFNVSLMNLGHTSMDYVSLNRPAAVVLTLAGGQQYSAQVLGPDYDRNALMIQMPPNSNIFQVHLPPNCLACEVKVSVHFEIDHHYYLRLHEGIDSVNEDILSKLIPSNPSRVSSSPFQITQRGRKSLDKKYQLQALKKMFTCSPHAPFLLLGPFGTGKTYLLAFAVANLIESGGKRVLVCTHLNRGANGLYKSLQERMKGVARHVARVVGHQTENVWLQNASVIYPDENVKRFSVLVTTFGVAIRLIDFVENGDLEFSHILIDEGAQCPEPEVLGALVLATRRTKIIIVGDNKQVGPQVRVISEKARHNGLGESLLERLFFHYKAVGSLSETHTSTLLTNYRCHPSILMLASSLFYECALISESRRETHPKAPYPLVFACTSIKEKEFMNCSPENEEEAKLLISKMIEFIQTWKHIPKEPIGLLASTKQQVACLRKNWRLMKSSYHVRRFQVEILPTYNIQGEEFSAVFLSTIEPTDAQGAPANRIRSICNEYVFNTVVTRAQSLIFVVGNPLFLLHMGSHFQNNCWMEYIRRCIQCQSFELPKICSSEAQNLPKIVGDICERVLLGKSIQQAKEEEIDVNQVDAIVERYLSDLNERREFKIAMNLVQSPSGDISWVEQKAAEETDKGIVWCKLDCNDFRRPVARPLHPNSTDDPIRLKAANTICQRKGALHGGIVRVDIIRKCVLFDEDTEQALASTHFGVSFLCRVDPNNPILFFPLDRRYPKFVNLPVLSVRSKSGVVCFDPKSINSSAKVSNFIPLEVATKMLFLVKFLGWDKWRSYPLGIIVAALPQGHSSYTGELVARISHGIAQNPSLTEPISPLTPNTSLRIFTGAFTIDPKGSRDHDDALTCRLVSTKDSGSVYEVGVHITDVQKFIPMDSKLDKQAFLRGCAAYCHPGHCIGCMLPKEMIQNELSITEGSIRSSLSVIVQYSVDNEGTVEEHPNSITFIESQVQSTLELTYEEAQKLICREIKASDDHLFSNDGKVARYNNQSYKLRIEDQLKLLWKIAMFIRRKRLGEDAAYALIVEDPHHRNWPEAHFLIQEMMIWTNTQVAVKLLKTFPEHTPLRVQNRPSEEELTNLKDRHGEAMATSLSLRGYVTVGQAPTEQVHVENNIYRKTKESLDSGQIQSVFHCIQFEHLHPQIAVAIAGLRQTKKLSTTDYVVSKVDAEYDFWHDTLQCAQYTHFTSPIRRYIDIVVQRLLLAAIHKRSCPYTKQELQEICRQVKEAVKRSNNYDRDVQRLYLATELREVGQDGICFVQQITEDAAVELTFTDPRFKVLYAKEKLIALKDLNARCIPLTQEKERSLVSNSKPTEHSHSKEAPRDSTFTWQAKISSFNGNARSFFSNPMFEFQPIKHSSDFDQHRHAEVSLLCPENGIVSENSNLVENKIVVTILPYTCTVPAEKWIELQQIIKRDICDPDHFLKSVKQTFAFDSPTSNRTCFSSEVTSPSPMWIYRLHRPIKMSEVLKVQLTTSCHDYLLSPNLQLVEVGPQLKICVQHNRNASECFADKLTECASKRRYESMEEYFKSWEQVLLYEAVVESLTESELLFIKDVSLKWPELEYQCDSLGQASYRLIIPAGHRKAGVVMEIPKEFKMMSHEFFAFKVGDLLCIRYSYEDNEKTHGFVLHMIVHHICVDSVPIRNSELEKASDTVYLKFVKKSNFISPRVAELLTSSNDRVSMTCEIQLLPLTLPFRRIYRCLQNLKFDENISSLARQIAKGTARTTNTDDLWSIDTMMTPEETSVVTSIWPITRREYGSGRKKLNRYQRHAINLACSNNFTLIQGPPGTGKSVTGAHLAYALAKKLRRERSSLEPSKLSSGAVRVEELKLCVMYCGPSNQAVNVVLNYLIQDGVSVKDELKILRVFSKTIEQKDYPGPKLNEGVFPKLSTSETKCEPNHEQYALHKKIRAVDPTINEMDKEFEQLHRQSKIPSIAMRRTYRKVVHAAEFKVLKSGFDIILCTCNEASSHRITMSVRPVYCIVDECAMSTEPECMVPIQRADHVVLIGDHQQLRPVIKNREAEAKGLGTSLFERYARKVNEQPPLQKPHMLLTQYRMHEELCKFPSDEFYDGNLKTDPSIRRRTDKETRLRFWPQGPRKPFVFVNVEGVESVSHTGRKGKARVGLESKFNKLEAKKIAEIAHVLVKRHKVPEASLTALTPYSSQKEEIKKQLLERRLSEIPVKTITESQGSESGIVLLSTVRSKPQGEISTHVGSTSKRKNADIGWIRRNLGFVTDRHQICVGLTRCKYGLVIVGNMYLLSYDETWKKLIDHYKKNDCVIINGNSFPQRPQHK